MDSIEHPPFLSLRENHQELIGNARFEGFIPDVTEKLGALMNADFQIHLSQDKQYGRSNPDGSNWTGLVGNVVRGYADLAIADLTITPERLEAVQFSQPISDSGIVVIVKKGGKHDLKSLIEDDETVFTVAGGGSSEAFIRGSLDANIMKIAEKLTASTSNADVFEKVKTLGHVGLMESRSARYLIQDDCEFEIVGSPLRHVHYGIAMAKGAAMRTDHGVEDLRQVLDWAVTKLYMDGTMDRLEKKWWKERHCH